MAAPRTESALRAALVVVGIEALAYALVLPQLPLVVGDQAPWWAVGLLFGGYSILQFAAIGPIGRMAERWGVRRVTAACLVGTGIGLVMTALSTDYWVLLAARLIDGASGGTVVLVTGSTLASLPHREWTRALGLLSAVRGGAAFFGIVATAGVGVALADPEAGLRTMAWAGTGIVVVSLLLVPALSKVPARDEDTAGSEMRPVTRREFATHVSAQAAQGGIVVLSPALGATVSSVRIGFLAPAAAIIGLAIGQVLVSPRTEAPGRLRWTMVGLLLVGLISLPFGRTVLVGCVLTGIAIGSVTPRVQAALIRGRMVEGASDLDANVLAGRGAIIGQTAGPVGAYAGLSGGAGVATGVIGLLSLFAMRPNRATHPTSLGV